MCKEVSDLRERIVFAKDLFWDTPGDLVLLKNFRCTIFNVDMVDVVIVLSRLNDTNWITSLQFGERVTYIRTTRSNRNCLFISIGNYL